MLYLYTADHVLNTWLPLQLKLSCELCKAWSNECAGMDSVATCIGQTLSFDGELCLMQPVQMQVLNLDFSTLSELPASLGQLTALTTLDVEGNPYLGETFRPDNLMLPPAFPMELSGLQALKYINLNSCGLTSVPEVQPHFGACLFRHIDTFRRTYHDAAIGCKNPASLMAGWFAQARQSV